MDIDILHFNFSEVVQADTLNAKTLYSNAKLFIANAFVSAKNVTQLEDENSNTILPMSVFLSNSKPTVNECRPLVSRPTASPIHSKQTYLPSGRLLINIFIFIRITITTIRNLYLPLYNFIFTSLNFYLNIHISFQLWTRQNCVNLLLPLVGRPDGSFHFLKGTPTSAKVPIHSYRNSSRRINIGFLYLSSAIVSG